MRYPPVESSSAARAILSPTGGRANSHWVAFAAGLLAYTETSGSAPCHAEVTRAVADADGYCRQRTNSAASTTTEGASELSAPEGIRTPNLLIRRHGPMVRPGAMRVPLSCRWRCREARLSSSLSSELSSAHSAKQRHSQRFLIPGDPALTIGCVKGGGHQRSDVEDVLYSEPIGKSHAAE
jgi:hypothetical protein